MYRTRQIGFVSVAAACLLVLAIPAQIQANNEIRHSGVYGRPVPGGPQIREKSLILRAKNSASDSAPGFKNGKGSFSLMEKMGRINTAEACSDNQRFYFFFEHKTGNINWRSMAKIPFTPFLIRENPGKSAVISFNSVRPHQSQQPVFRLLRSIVKATAARDQSDFRFA